MVAQVSWQQASQGCISVKDNKKKSLVSIFYYILGLPGWRGRESACQCRRHKRFGFDPWVQKTPQSRKLEPVPIFLPGKFHGQRILVGYSSWGHKESDMTEQLSNNHLRCSSSGCWPYLISHCISSLLKHYLTTDLLWLFIEDITFLLVKFSYSFLQSTYITTWYITYAFVYFFFFHLSWLECKLWGQNIWFKT